MLADSMWAGMFEMPQIAIVMGCLVPIAGVIGVFWYKAQRVRYETELKRKLAERGMSADEIERIVAAGSEDSGRNFLR